MKLAILIFIMRRLDRDCLSSKDIEVYVPIMIDKKKLLFFGFPSSLSFFLHLLGSVPVLFYIYIYFFCPSICFTFIVLISKLILLVVSDCKYTKLDIVAETISTLPSLRIMLPYIKYADSDRPYPTTC